MYVIVCSGNSGTDGELIFSVGNSTINTGVRLSGVIGYSVMWLLVAALGISKFCNSGALYKLYIDCGVSSRVRGRLCM